MDLYDVRRFDPHMGTSLERLAAAARAYTTLGTPRGPLLVDGVPLEDLCLVFVLPGRVLTLLCLLAPHFSPCPLFHAHHLLVCLH